MICICHMLNTPFARFSKRVALTFDFGHASSSGHSWLRLRLQTWHSKQTDLHTTHKPEPRNPKTTTATGHFFSRIPPKPILASVPCSSRPVAHPARQRRSGLLRSRLWPTFHSYDRNVLSFKGPTPFQADCKGVLLFTALISHDKLHAFPGKPSETQMSTKDRHRQSSQCGPSHHGRRSALPRPT